MYDQQLPNPNNKNQQDVYNVEGQNFQACMITPLGINDVQLISGRVFQNKSPTIIIQESKEDEIQEKDESIDQESISLREYVPIQSKYDQINQAPIVPLIKQPYISSQEPHFPKRLKIDKGIERKTILLDYDMLDELNNVCIKIYLIQSKYDIPIF